MKGAEGEGAVVPWADQTHALVLFDGVCNLCNASVTFIVDRDPDGYFQFASLQSDLGQASARAYGADASRLDSILLVQDGRLYRESAAALRIALRLGALWPLMGAFFVVPAFLRDPVYRWIARNRYRWFGHTESCRIPQPHERDRFLA